MNKEIVKTFVIGHKNPDTDSICSAISYAYFKNQVCGENEKYIPCRAGSVSEETKYVLNYFHFEAPKFIADISTQVKDIEICKIPGVNRKISLKKAWSIMKEQDLYTLPVLRSNQVEGVITTEDIAQAYMDVYDNAILSTAHTKLANIVETIEGNMVTGEIEKYFTKGKVVIAASDVDIVKQYVEEDDLVILGNLKENQLCALEKKAGVIIVCEGSEVEEEILKKAKEQECAIILTKYDAFTTARLINQSMPISYFMTREGLVTFQDEDHTENVREVMSKKRYRDFPVLDAKGDYLGMMSRRDLLNATQKRVILVDHNEKSQTVDGLEDAQVVEIIDHHRIGNVETLNPIYFRNQPLGCTATIIYQMMTENQVEIPSNIAGLLLSAIISDTLMFRSPTCTAVDKDVAEKLAAIAKVDIEQLALAMFKAGSDLSGKSAEEIFYQDFKKFTVDGVSFGIGQVSAMTNDELDEIKNKVADYMEKAYKELGVGSVYFMLTNILEESSEIVFAGEEAPQIVEKAFSYKDGGNSVYLKGVVSRKKQLLPSIMQAIQN